jgi:hypothetical protein
VADRQKAALDRFYLARVGSQRERAVDHGTDTSHDAGGVGDTRQPFLRQAALDNAHARIWRLQQENAQLYGELGEAPAARDLADEHVSRLLGDLFASIERAGVGATTPRLSGTERLLKIGNDAVRLWASWEADALRAEWSTARADSRIGLKGHNAPTYSPRAG